MKKLLLFIFIAGIMVGCSSSSSSTISSSSTDGAVSTLTYDIDPEKTTYTAGEEFVITATISGETVVNSQEVGALFDTNYTSCGSISSWPVKDSTTYTDNAGSTSGCTITVTAYPSNDYEINGVDQVTGNATFTITTE